MKRIILTLAVTATSLVAATNPPQLKFVVILSRHGVRAPTWELNRLNQYSAEPWPDFKVPPGELTPRGRLLITQMGAYYSNWFTRDHLLNPANCNDTKHINIYADTDQRTIETANAFSESLLNNCSIKIQSLPENAQPSSVDPALTKKAIAARITPDLATKYQPALDELQNILGKPFPDQTPPFNTASTLTENLLLEYANGFQGQDLGWGRLTLENLNRVIVLHDIYADITRQTSEIAKARGGKLVEYISAALQNASITGDKLLLISGHDTNQANLAGILSLRWNLPGYQQNETPPGSALIFTLWSDDTVRLFFVAQTLDQMHNGIATKPEQQEISIPWCQSPCSISNFATGIKQKTE